MSKLIVNRTFELQDGRLIDIPMDVMEEIDKSYDHQFKCIEKRAEIRKHIINVEAISVFAIALAAISIIAAGIVNHRFENLEKEVDALRKAKLAEKKIEQTADVPGGSMIIQEGDTNEKDTEMERKTESTENRDQRSN